MCLGCSRAECFYSRLGCARQSCSDGLVLAASRAGWRQPSGTARHHELPSGSETVTAIPSIAIVMMMIRMMMMMIDDGGGGHGDDIVWFFELPNSKTIWRLCSNLPQQQQELRMQGSCLGCGIKACMSTWRSRTSCSHAGRGQWVDRCKDGVTTAKLPFGSSSWSLLPPEAGNKQAFIQCERSSEARDELENSVVWEHRYYPLGSGLN